MKLFSRIVPPVVGLLLSATCVTAAAGVVAKSSSTVSSFSGGSSSGPSSFTKNLGQWPDSVRFRANVNGATVWFTSTAVYYQLTRRIPGSGFDQVFGGSALGQSPLTRQAGRDSIETTMFKAVFVGANPNVEIVPENQSSYMSNFFVGSDKTKWRTDVPNYQAVSLRNLFNGVNLRFTTSPDGHLSYQFAIEPTADVNQIKFAYEGVTAPAVDASGQVTSQTAWGTVSGLVASPAVNASLSSGEFSVLTLRNRNTSAVGGGAALLSPAAIGPIYSTYLGGGSDEFGQSIAVDGSGAPYVTGWTTSINFPTQNPGQTDQPETDAFVVKLDPSGTSLIYSTYLGGDSADLGFGIAVDANGNAYVIGETRSSDFPTQNPFQATNHGGLWDAFVTKLSPAGNSLAYSTYLGGSDAELAVGIALDTSGSAYVTGSTKSSDFPTQGPIQAYAGGYDVFVAKLSPAGSSLAYSTFLGGTGTDEGQSIAVDSGGNAHVTGVTTSSNFPTQNPYQVSPGGAFDAFVAKLAASGSSLIYSTYLGGSGDDYGYCIAVDVHDYAYVTGWTRSSNFPTKNALKSNLDSLDAFVTKIAVAGDTLVYSTYLGGTGGDQGSGIAVDKNGHAFIVGATSSPNFPTQSSFQAFQGGTFDAFITELSRDGSSLFYSSCLGGTNNDWGYGIAVNDSGQAFVTGQTQSANFPTVNPFQGSFQGGSYDAFVTKLREVGCCVGVRGNVDLIGIVDLADLNLLVSYLTGNGTLPCFDAANVNGVGIVDLADLNALVAYLTGSGHALLFCP